MFVCVSIVAHVCGGPVLMLGVFLDCYSFFIEVGPFTVCCSGYPNKLTCPGKSLVLFPLPHFHVAFGDLNSGCHPCGASALATEPSP